MIWGTLTRALARHDRATLSKLLPAPPVKPGDDAWEERRRGMEGRISP